MPSAIGPELRDRIIDALSKPRPYEAIAKEHGVSLTTVRGIASANGFTAYGRFERKAVRQ
jgi:hypothetical protein